MGLMYYAIRQFSTNFCANAGQCKAVRCCVLRVGCTRDVTCSTWGVECSTNVLRMFYEHCFVLSFLLCFASTTNTILANCCLMCLHAVLQLRGARRTRTLAKILDLCVARLGHRGWVVRVGFWVYVRLANGHGV